jgi:hypothetical protein
MKNIYYVYQYIRENGSPYYIGKGKNNRAWVSHRRSNSAELKPDDNTRIQILKENLTDQEAFTLEKELIRTHGLKSEGGLLVNLLYGGQGYSPGIEMRQRHSESMKGVNKGRKIGPPTTEIRQKRSAAIKEWYKTVDKSSKAWNTWHSRYTSDYTKYENAINLLKDSTIMRVVKETGFDYETIRRLKDKSHSIYSHFPSLVDIIA